MFLPKPGEGGSFELVPAGTHIAICYRFIDRGTQQSSYQGKPKLRHEIMLSWELPDEMMSDGRPFTISKVYTWSMSEKAALRADLESWRGKSFNDGDFDGPNAFNVRKLLGVPCMLTVIHKRRDDGSDSHNVSSVGKIVKGVNVPPPVNGQAYLALTKDGFDRTVFDNLSDKMREAIMRSPEYRELTDPRQHEVHDEYPDDGGYGAGPDDEIPF